VQRMLAMLLVIFHDTLPWARSNYLGWSQAHIFITGFLTAIPAFARQWSLSHLLGYLELCLQFG